MKKLLYLLLTAIVLFFASLYYYLERTPALPDHFISEHNLVAPSDIKRYDPDLDAFENVPQNGNINLEDEIYTFSFIIPVHNTVEYIEGAVQSIISQEIKSYEIILIENNSKDDSLSMCKTLARNDKNIKLYTQTNGGAGGARNTGLLNARGKYILYLDSDDFYEPGALKEDDFEKLEEYSMILFGHNNVDVEDDHFIKYRDINYKSLQPVNSTRYHTRDFSSLNMVADSAFSMCNKICKRQFLIDNDLLFPNQVRYEDYYVVLKLCTKNFDFFPINLPLFNYRINRAASQSNNGVKMFEIFYILDRFKLYLEEEGIYEDFRDALFIQEFEQVFYRLHKLPLPEAYQWIRFMNQKYKKVEGSLPTERKCMAKINRIKNYHPFYVMVFHVIPKRLEIAFRSFLKRD